MPTLYTPPLREDFDTDGTKLLQVVDLAWRDPENQASEFSLDEWQRWLIEHVLERYPADHPKYPGELRYRQVVISMGRQNGKSVLGAIFGLYGLLLHVGGPEVISVASSVKQANIIYERVRLVVNSNQALAKRFKVTGTRGIRSKVTDSPGSYFVQTGKEDALQGVTISLCLFDEVHICKPETWSAVVLGTSARKNGMVLGITTAGDESSELLKSLYDRGKAAVDGDDERFGFFLWEAPAHADVTDHDAIKAANPAVACGRKDVEQVASDLQHMPENKARRYGLNQFVASASSWLPSAKWKRLEVAALPHYNDVVFAVDRTDNWGAATITASVRHEGRIHTQVVASIPNPSLDWLEAICEHLWDTYGGLGFVMEVSNLRDLSARLKERGIKCEYLTQTQMQNACATVYSLISEGAVVHAGDDLLTAQVPAGVAKNTGDGWRITRKDSVGDVDALLATIMGVYAAEVMKPNGPMLFVA